MNPSASGDRPTANNVSEPPEAPGARGAPEPRDASNAPDPREAPGAREAIDPRDAPDQIRARVAELEVLVMHLERGLSELNAAVLRQGRQLDALEDLVEHLLARGQLADGAEAPRRLEDDRPPHY